MANPEHLDILKKGVDVWNAWVHTNRTRATNDFEVPQHDGVRVTTVGFWADLVEADLTGTQLCEVIDIEGSCVKGVSEKGYDLRSADLRGAKLDYAELAYANLAGATLLGAQLKGANLIFTDFRGANLSGTNLTETLLAETNFFEANLRGTDFTRANLYEVNFSDTDLTSAKGLHTCLHGGPSTIDHRTLFNSGHIPVEFLKGCGLPDTLIEYLPSLLHEPIQFYSCFISYSSKNQLFADRLYADLQSSGVRCWLASEDLKIGEKMRLAIDQSIRFHDKLLLILSRHSIASDWVEQEVETALDRERRESRTILFPIRLDNTVLKIDAGWPALIRNTRNIGDFCRWKNYDSYQQAFGKLLQDLKAERQK